MPPGPLKGLTPQRLGCVSHPDRHTNTSWSGRTSAEAQPPLFTQCVQKVTANGGAVSHHQPQNDGCADRTHTGGRGRCAVLATGTAPGRGREPALFERYVEADSALYLKAPDRGLTLILLGNSGGLSEAFQ